MKEWLEGNGYQILSFDPNCLVAFKNNSKSVHIFIQDLSNPDDEGDFFTLLYDELATIYKAIFDEY
jgi:hypothetical protein